MINIAIVDNEYSMVSRIENLILSYNQSIFQLEIFIDGDSFLSYYNRSGMVDIVFMDIEMPGRNGIETIRKLRLIDDNVKVIFITSHTNYFYNAFELRAYQYLNKPLNEKKFFDTLDRVVVELSKHKENILKIKTIDGIRGLPLSQVMYMETISKKIHFQTKSEIIIAENRMSLASIVNKIDKTLFGQCYKSIWVQYKYIEKLEEDALVLKNKIKIPLSKKYKKSFIADLSNYHWRVDLCK